MCSSRASGIASGTACGDVGRGWYRIDTVCRRRVCGSGVDTARMYDDKRGIMYRTTSLCCARGIRLIPLAEVCKRPLAPRGLREGRGEHAHEWIDELAVVQASKQARVDLDV